MATQLPADFEEYLAGPRIPDTTANLCASCLSGW